MKISHSVDENLKTFLGEKGFATRLIVNPFKPRILLVDHAHNGHPPCEVCLQGLMVVLFINIGLHICFDEYSYHFSPRARLIEEIRELKQRRRLVKNDFRFYKQNLRLSRSVRYANGPKNALRLNIQRRRSVFQMEMRKISRRRPRSVDDLELGHFTLLFCRGRQRNVRRLITYVHSYCSTH